MKKLIFLTIVSFSLFSASAQWNNGYHIYNTTAGSVGIGTSTPIGTLQIKAPSVFDGSTRLYLTNNATEYGRTNLILTGRIQNGNDAWSFGTNARNSIVFAQNQGTTVGEEGVQQYSIQLEGTSNSLGFLSATNGNVPNMTLRQGGNVGIGTTTPTYRFEVNTTSGSEQSSLGIERVSAISTTPLMPTTRLVYNWYESPKAAINFHRGGGDQDGFISFSTSHTGTLVERMRIFRDGNVGIGTTDAGNYKLAVEGKIGAREVKVTLASWADYVFNKDYNLMSLANLETFIKKNNHLPNIPSAQEVKENGGIDLGEMNAKLLEKIEELTLYVIELKKENDAIREEVKKLSSQRQEVRQQITTIKP